MVCLIFPEITMHEIKFTDHIKILKINMFKIY